jgi:hypothetical protein
MQLLAEGVEFSGAQVKRVLEAAVLCLLTDDVYSACDQTVPAVDVELQWAVGDVRISCCSVHWMAGSTGRHQASTCMAVQYSCPAHFVQFG